MKRIISYTLLLFICGSLSAQTVFGDVTLPNTFKAGDATLVLNGGGIREKFFMDIYVAGLYLTSKKKDADAIIKANEAMAVKLHIVSGMATSDRMSEAVEEGFQKSTNKNTGPIRDKINKFLNVLKKEEIVKGNIFDFTYTPAEGTKIYKNGKLQETIPGLDFKIALFGIWLGKDPVSTSLKDGMLGVK